MKRLLASLLCATLILSPVGNASTVHATETAEVIQQVQETEEGQQDTDDVVAASEEDAVKRQANVGKDVGNAGERHRCCAND